MKLLPCPFCGGAARSEIVCLSTDVVTVKCSNSFNCPVGPIIRDDAPKGQGEATLARFKKQWNQRVQVTKELEK